MIDVDDYLMDLEPVIAEPSNLNFESDRNGEAIGEPGKRTDSDEPDIFATAPPTAPQSGPFLRPDGSAYRADLPLFNASTSPVVYVREKWQHREIAFLRCMGYNNKEIAERSGYSLCSVNNILRQPWIIDLIKEETARQAREGIAKVLNEEQAIISVEKLIELRDDKAAAKEIQRKAANDILNRVYGMPNQSIMHTNVKDPATLSDAELAKIAQGAIKN